MHLDIVVTDYLSPDGTLTTFRITPGEVYGKIAVDKLQDIHPDTLRIPMKSSTSSGHAVHLSERSDASEIIIPSSGRHGQGRIDFDSVYMSVENWQRSGLPV